MLRKGWTIQWEGDVPTENLDTKLIQSMTELEFDERLVSSLEKYAYTKEEINFEVISINGIFGDSIICSECFHKFNKVEVNNERKD